MARPKKNPITDPTGEKASAKAAKTKAAASPSIGERAQEVAQSIGTNLQAMAESPVVSGTVNNIGQAVSATANAVTNAVAATSQTLTNVKQATQPLGIGYQGQFNGLITDVSPMGGIQLPTVDFQGCVPTDLLHPNIQLKASEQELTVGLAEYAAGVRAQKLLQAGFSYIAEVGKTKQLFHKAEQSFVKAATEEVKTQQALVGFDRANIQLDTEIQKREQDNERLKQAQVTTNALAVETAQLTRKYEAIEGKRDAEIRALEAQTQDIIQKYLKDSIANGG